MDPDDGELWQNARLGDAEAFGSLFERHANAIYNFCFRRIGDWAAAEDLLAIVFLEAWRRRDVELRAENVLPWLYGIALNVVRNERRSRRRFAAALDRLPPPEPEGLTAVSPDERLDDERQMKEVQALLAHLPQREQEAFVLCAWCDLSYEEAAAALRIPIGTVRSRLSRARSRLRILAVSLEPEDVDEPERAPEVAKP